MKDTVWMGIKIVSGIVVVVIGTLKIIEDRRNKTKETPENEETTE